MRKFKLKRGELEGALATYNPKNSNTMCKKKIAKKTLEPSSIPYFTPCTHMNNS
jgi:hypothetical protein